jgi:glycosyltransferase involved in cell wall biosynthesis
VLHDLAPLIGRDWDVLYFPWNSAAAANLTLFELGKPVVVSCRGSQILVAPTNPRRSREVERYLRALDKATAVHCVCDAVRISVEAKGIRPTKISVIPPGIDTEKFEPSDQIPNYAGPVRLITAGNLSWVKGQEFLLGALGLLRASEVDFRLRIIGDGPERQRLLYTIGDLGLSDSVDLLGPYEETQVRDELRQADIFVLSSLSEGISNAALEAMSCGLPVVSTDVGGMAEAIRDGVEGRLVPPRDPEATAEAIAQLGGDRQLRLQMGAAARERVVSQFSLERHIAAWRELLDTVLQRHRVGAMP